VTKEIWICSSVRGSIDTDKKMPKGNYIDMDMLISFWRENQMGSFKKNKA
jgi:hypothetical protein